MKIKKGFLATSLALALSFPLQFTVHAEAATFTNDNGLEIKDTDYQRLISLGFTDDEIQQMDQEEFDFNAGLSGERISTETQYIKTTEIVDTTQNVSYDKKLTIYQLNQMLKRALKKYYHQMNTIHIETGSIHHRACTK